MAPALNSRAVLAAVTSHAESLGVFDLVSGHEPETAPGNGVHAAFWAGRVRPVARASGLDATSALLVVTGQIYLSVNTEPADDVELNMLDATDALLAAFTGDFQLGAAVSHIDLLGIHGVPLEAEPGYARFGSQSGAGEVTKRIMRVTIPCVVHDAWTQSA
jgi:hypothetical protein